jgi:hypothetical protein
MNCPSAAKRCGEDIRRSGCCRLDPEEKNLADLKVEFRSWGYVMLN